MLFRDVEPFVGSLLLPWFFLTPMIWDESFFPGHETLQEILYWANPLTPPLEAFRNPLWAGTTPGLGDVIYLVVAAALSLAFGAWSSAGSTTGSPWSSDHDPTVVEPRFARRVRQRGQPLDLRPLPRRLGARNQRRAQEPMLEVRDASGSGTPRLELARAAQPGRPDRPGDDGEPLLVRVEQAPRPVRRRLAPRRQVRERLLLAGGTRASSRRRRTLWL